MRGRAHVACDAPRTAARRARQPWLGGRRKARPVGPLWSPTSGEGRHLLGQGHPTEVRERTVSDGVRMRANRSRAPRRLPRLRLAWAALQGEPRVRDLGALLEPSSARDYGHLRGTRGLGKNRPSGFLIRLRNRLAAVANGVSRKRRMSQANHRVAEMYSSKRIAAGPCIIRTPVGSMSCHDSATSLSGIRAA
jgi:hypothetical protein